MASTTLPDWVQGIAEAYAGCVAGALPKATYLEMLRVAGFDGIEVVSERRIEVPESLLTSALTTAQREAATRDHLHVLSVTVTATKP